MPGVYLLTDVQLAGEPLGVAFAFANAVLFALYIVLGHRVAQRGAGGGIDGLAASMLIAAVVVTPLGGWAALPALGDPVGARWPASASASRSSVIPYVCDQLAMARLRARDLRADGLAAAGDRDGDRHRRAGPDPVGGRGRSASAW